MARMQGREEPRIPLFFRVRGPDGRPVPWVELEARFAPGNEFVRGRRRTDASGTCLLHWPRSAASVRVRIEHGASSASVEVALVRPDPTRVVDVNLLAP